MTLLAKLWSFDKTLKIWILFLRYYQKKNSSIDDNILDHDECHDVPWGVGDNVGGGSLTPGPGARDKEVSNSPGGA